MWFALGTPVVLMVAAVLMERFEQHCTRAPARVEASERAPERLAPERTTLRAATEREVPRPAMARQVALPH
ncbi:hypothetical protein ACQPXB_26825 [Amycolatopsis sp. CA-161197]|uniref:hypothetical protein n=1 Tax=Amycolatopsis sp. CA-161197 TaxID=3239922 RepID=UPI003D8B0456